MRHRNLVLTHLSIIKYTGIGQLKDEPESPTAVLTNTQALKKQE